MRRYLVLVLAAVLCLAALVATEIHFARQEEAVREQWRRTVAAERATHRLPSGRHLVLDCVEIPLAQ